MFAVTQMMLISDKRSLHYTCVTLIYVYNHRQSYAVDHGLFSICRQYKLCRTIVNYILPIYIIYIKELNYKTISTLRTEKCLRSGCSNFILALSET